MSKLPWGFCSSAPWRFIPPKLCSCFTASFTAIKQEIRKLSRCHPQFSTLCYRNCAEEIVGGVLGTLQSLQFSVIWITIVSSSIIHYRLSNVHSVLRISQYEPELFQHTPHFLINNTVMISLKHAIAGTPLHHARIYPQVLRQIHKPINSK